MTDEEFYAQLADSLEETARMTEKRLAGGEFERRRDQIMGRVFADVGPESQPAERLPDIVWPPDGFVYLDGVMPLVSNYDHAINGAVALAVRAGGCFARHAARNFHGLVWFDGGRLYETVSVENVARATFAAHTFEELFKIVNDEFGWE